MSLNNEIKKFQNKLEIFARERDWNQFHNPKNIACALSVESSELLEIFQWLEGDKSFHLDDKQKQATKDEMADVFLYLIRLADLLKIVTQENFAFTSPSLSGTLYIPNYNKVSSVFRILSSPSRSKEEIVLRAREV